MATVKPTRPNVVAGNGHAPPRRSVVEEGTTFKGSISGNAPVLVRGVFEGEITGAAVEIDRNGVLLGKAKVSELRCRGELAGEFEAENAELSGHVRDKTVIRARSLLVTAADPETDGAAIFGECQIEVGDPPSKEQALQQALGQSRAPTASPAAPRPAPPVPPARAAATVPPPPVHPPAVPEPRLS